MKIAILLVLLSFRAALGQPEPEIKRAINLAFVLSAAEHIDEGVFKIPGAYVYDSSSKLIGQKYYGTFFPDKNVMTNEGQMTVFFTGDQFGGAEAKTGCGAEERPDFHPYSVTYDNAGKISTLELKKWLNRGQKFFKTRFTFGYSGEKIISIDKRLIIGEGKSSDAITPLWEDKQYRTSCQWTSDTDVTVSISIYKNRLINTDPEVISRSLKYIYQIKPGNLSITTIEGSRQSLKEYATRDNQVILTRTNSQSKSKEEIAYTLDNKKRILKITDVVFKGDLIDRRTETAVQYLLKDPAHSSDDLCNYRIRNIVNIFEGNGNQLQESNDTMFRRRNSDGTWGQWKTLPD